MIGNLGLNSGLHYADFIVELARLTGCETYLELGIYSGTTLDKIRPYVKRAIGVDTQDIRTNKTGEFFQGTTDAFFEKFHDPIDMVFIDADHSFESVKRDFEHSLELLTTRGIMIFHDVDPIEPWLMNSGYCGDTYKIVDYIQGTHSSMNIVCLPITEAGLAIVNRKQDRRVLSL
jgi:predicted O-methyltransferase YrrM